MGYEYMKVRGLCVDVSYLVMGPLENNVYILSDGKSAIVVDPCRCHHWISWGSEA